MHVSAVIFDLDNTLYDENLYLAEVIRVAGSRHNLDSQMMMSMLGAGRLNQSRDIFGDLLRDQDRYTPDLQAALFEIYRSVECTLSFNSEALALLKQLREAKIRIALLTNGDLMAQQNKVRVLNAVPLVDSIVYAREEGKAHEKPSTRAFARALSALGTTAAETLYVGDDPYTDIFGASRAGLRTVWLKADNVSPPESHYVIGRLAELGLILASLNSQPYEDARQFPA